MGDGDSISHHFAAILHAMEIVFLITMVQREPFFIIRIRLNLFYKKGLSLNLFFLTKKGSSSPFFQMIKRFSSTSL